MQIFVTKDMTSCPRATQRTKRTLGKGSFALFSGSSLQFTMYHYFDSVLIYHDIKIIKRSCVELLKYIKSKGLEIDFMGLW